MVISKETCDWALKKIATKPVVSLDCESDGLRVHHGSRLFSVAIADDEGTFYFNFMPYDGLDESFVLPREVIFKIFDSLNGSVVNHNIKFDLHLLLNEGVSLQKILKLKIHDTMVVARLLRNDLLQVGLDAMAGSVGEQKDKTVEEHIKKFKLYDVTTIPGKKTRFKNLHFHKVPFEIISVYAQKDAKIAFKLYEEQDRTITRWDAETHSKKIRPLVERENELVKVCLEIERQGIGINYPYVELAIKEETRRVDSAKAEIEAAIKRPFVDSRKSLVEIFPNAAVKLTEKGNKSYDEESLSGIDSPIARSIECYREHLKRKNTYFEAFRFHSTAGNTIHPTLNQHAAQTGRFSIKDPALQTLNKKEDLENPFPIRRSFIPRRGNCFVEMDYKSMEFVLMCDYAGEKTLIDALKNGHDPHQATASLVGCTRAEAKTINFGLLYGMGIKKLALSLGIPLEEAKKLKSKYFDALPYVDQFIKNVTRTAKNRGYIFNCFGRRFFFPDHNWAYKAPNALIQGTGADVCKAAMVAIHQFLADKDSKMVLQIHDAILFDIPPHEFHIIPHLKKLMVEAYPYRHIPLSVTVEHSWESWGDLKEGEPIGRETGEFVQSPRSKVSKDVGQMLVREG